MEATKPFNISRQQVMEAFKAVKANAGAAGVDEKDPGESVHRRNRTQTPGSIRALAARDDWSVCLMGAV